MLTEKSKVPSVLDVNSSNAIIASDAAPHKGYK